jgi:hypothetical protein
MVAVGRDGGVWQRVSRKERCPICGHDSWCGMIVGEVVACMRQADGARFSKPGKDGQIRHYHDWPDRAAPIPIRPQAERPVDWAAPAATTCRALYTAIAARYAGRPRSKACAAEGVRRFGDRALDALAASDSCEIDERDLLAWLDAEGRVADAKSAGILTDDGKLAPALKGRKVYAFRLPDGTVANLRGRDLTGRSPLKVLDLAGGYEERGADAGLYHAERVADVADGAGWLHLAGGCEKADALIAAGFSAVSTPGEGTLFDAALADLTARRVLSVAVWVDAEDPKEGEHLSAGRRLGLAVAERLAAAGISVRVVEPAREPGAPKRDADGILRDGGPGALWDCWAGSEDLAAFRERCGVGSETEHAARLAALANEKAELARQLRECAARQSAIMEALSNEAIGPGERIAFVKLTFEVAHKREQPGGLDDRGRATVRLGELARGSGMSEKRVGVYLDRFGQASEDNPDGWGIIEKKTEYAGKLRGGLPISEVKVRQEADVTTSLREFATFKPEKPRNHGGRRTPCPACGGVETVTQVRCAACGELLSEHRNAAPDGQDDCLSRDDSTSVMRGGCNGQDDRPENPPTSTRTNDADFLTLSRDDSDGHLDRPADTADAAPPTVRCLSAGRGCPNRVPPHLDYCPDCERDGWHNHRGAS